MIWTIKIECERGMYLEEEFIRVIEIKSDTTLDELHLIIQNLAEFDNDHLYEFYVGRSARNRKMVLTGDDWDMFDDYDENTDDEENDLMLDSIFPLPKGLKLYYLFDFGDSWLFKITRSRQKPKESEKGVEYPRVISGVGPPPQQYPDWEE